MEMQLSAKYLVRIDDVCPTMNWSVWDRVERILTEGNVRPILAVVPDNRDPKLKVSPPRADFWDLVREWQGKGWTVGWHGYQHVYDSSDAGLVGINRRSEFSGVAKDVQLTRLRAARDIFLSNRVRPDLWVAPAHSFDRNTVELLQEFGVAVLSDGFFMRPVVSLGSLWIPQQLWRFRPMPSGVWTVCFHINGWGDSDVSQLERDIGRFSSKLIGVSDLLGMPRRPKGILDAGFERAYRGALLLKRTLPRFVRAEA
jgi:predicted deacetylase